MSYEQFDTDGRPVHKDCCGQCLGKYDPREDPMEFLSLLSFSSLSIGIVLVMVAYIYPRDYTFDPNMEAVKMERIEMYYDALGYRLDVLVLVGMSFVVTGGLILAGIICYLHVTADFWAQVCGDEFDEEGELGVQTNTRYQSYGSNGPVATKEPVAPKASSSPRPSAPHIGQMEQSSKHASAPSKEIVESST